MQKNGQHRVNLRLAGKNPTLVCPCQCAKASPKLALFIWYQKMARTESGYRYARKKILTYMQLNFDDPYSVQEVVGMLLDIAGIDADLSNLLTKKTRYRALLISIARSDAPLRKEWIIECVIDLMKLHQDGRLKNMKRMPGYLRWIKPHDHVFSAECFYTSSGWKSLRYKALRSRGNKCEACGRGPEDGIKIHVDHIYPRSIFPEKAMDLDNLQILCNECNQGKSNKYTDDWRR